LKDNYAEIVGINKIKLGSRNLCSKDMNVKRAEINSEKSRN